MRIHHYHPVTGIFIASGTASLDPEELRLAQRKARDGLVRAKKQTVAEHREAQEQAAAAVTPTHWLIPAFSTTKEPPSAPAGKQAVFVAGAWKLQDAPALA